ncbi:MAG: hypothetical protein Q7R95_01870 [bacterium]|nr:hypothetical protein [bacterium]
MNETEDKNNKWANVSIESIKMKEKMLIEINGWWTREITSCAQNLENESNKINPSWEVVEDLQKKLEVLQARGRFEENECNKFSKIKEEYLFYRLMSGVNSTKL